MGLDIRKPIGLMLLLTGVQLAAYGLLGSGEVYQRSLGINVNLWWGSALAVFGLIFFALGRRG